MGSLSLGWDFWSRNWKYHRQMGVPCPLSPFVQMMRQIAQHQLVKTNCSMALYAAKQHMHSPQGDANNN